VPADHEVRAIAAVIDKLDLLGRYADVRARGIRPARSSSARACTDVFPPVTGDLHPARSEPTSQPPRPAVRAVSRHGEPCLRTELGPRDSPRGRLRSLHRRHLGRTADSLVAHIQDSLAELSRCAPDLPRATRHASAASGVK
jgi:hypothetical protein